MTTRGTVPVSNNDRQRHLEKTFKKEKAKQHRLPIFIMGTQ